MTAYPSESKGHTGWKSRKAKYLWRESSRVSCSGKETLLSVSRYDGVTPAKEESRSESLKGYKVVERGDLVINIMLAWMGALGVSDYDGIVSPAYAVYKPIVTMLPKFLHYLYRTPEYLAEFAKRSTGVVPSRWRMYGDDFGQVLTWLPPLPEQEAIVAYLDSATAKLDQVIASEERAIDFLQERKQIIINQAVTRGLDSSVQLKPSGISWLGEIPKGWEVRKIFGLFVENKKKNKACAYRHAMQFNYGQLIDKTEPLSEQEVKAIYSKYTLLHKNDIVINGLNLNYDMVSQRIAIAGKDGIITSAYIAMTPRKDICPKYFCYLFKGMDSQKLFHGMGTGIRLTLSFRELRNQLVPIPPPPEQDAIASYLDAATAKIDRAIEVKRRQIELLRERREIIIDAAVTGKAKVS